MKTRRAAKWQMNKAEREKLHRKFLRLMKERGASQGGVMYQWCMDTQLGELGLSFDEEHGAIFCRFQDVDKACVKLNPNRHCISPLWNRLNPYSGKWNFHFGKVSAAAAWAEFWREIKPIL